MMVLLLGRLIKNFRKSLEIFDYFFLKSKNIILFDNSKMEQLEEINLLSELKIFGGYFIEMYLLLLIIQILSDKIDNSTINYFKDIKMALLISSIVYIARCINEDYSANIRQGCHYILSGVFMANYNV